MIFVLRIPIFECFIFGGGDKGQMMRFNIMFNENNIQYVIGVSLEYFETFTLGYIP